MPDEPEEPTSDPEESSAEDSGSAPSDDSPPPMEDTPSGEGADSTALDDFKDSLDEGGEPGEPAPAPGGPIAIGQGKLSESDDKTFGMLVHLLGPFTSFVGPLVIWLIKREESPFVDDQGKESLNFQITIGIGFLIVFILSFVPFVQCVTVLLLPALGIVDLIFCILACVESSKGTVYRYPFNVRLVT